MMAAPGAPSNPPTPANQPNPADDFERKNTVLFNWTSMKTPTEKLEIFDIANGLGLDIDMVATMDYIFHLRKVVVKFNEEKDFLMWLARAGTTGTVEYRTERQTHTVQMEAAGRKEKAVTVRYVQKELPLQALKKALGTYGEVRTVSRETITKKGKTLQTEGVIVTMTVTKNIPFFMTILGFQLNISYTGQKRTCKVCGTTQHTAAECRPVGGKKAWATLPPVAVKTNRQVEVPVVATPPVNGQVVVGRNPTPPPTPTPAKQLASQKRSLDIKHPQTQSVKSRKTHRAGG